MKIVRLIARLNVGGPAKHVVWLNEALNDHEYESVLVSGRVPEGEEDMSFFASEHGIKPVYIEQMSRELSLRDVVSLMKVYSLIRKEQPDILHTHTAKAGTIGRVSAFAYKWLTPSTLIGKPRKIKVLHTFHGHVFHSYYGKAKTNLFLLIERMLAKYATDKIVVISETQKREINEDFGIGKEKQFEVVPLGLDLKVFESAEANREDFRNEIGVDQDTILVGIVGRVTEIKNHQMFLEVAARALSEGEGKISLKFVVIGSGNQIDEIKKHAEDLKLGSNIIFLGNRNDPERFYAGLDIVSLTSLNEGTPLSIIEAMACGKPVISTDVGGVADLLGEVVENCDGYVICERGIMAASEDVNGFTRGLEHLMRDRNLKLQITEKSKDFVRQNFSVSRLVLDVKKLYHNSSEIK